jgi:hypothetical protein
MVSRSLKLNVIIMIPGRGMELRDIALTLDYKTVKNEFKGYKLYNFIFKDSIKIF